MVDYLYVLVVLSFILLDIPSFLAMDINIHSITKQFNKCRKSDVLRTYHGLTVEQCLMECQQREYCKSINYNRLVEYCQLVGKPEIDDIQTCTSYVSMDKADWKQILPTPMPSCPGYKRMDPTDGTCATAECKVPTLTNGVVYGNLFAVGMKVKFQCNDGYVPTSPVVYSTCSVSGVWTPQGPTCVAPVDGGWTTWSEWGSCPMGCTSSRSRSCSNPEPENGGNDCPGVATEPRCCRGGDCPTHITDILTASTNNQRDVTLTYQIFRPAENPYYTCVVSYDIEVTMTAIMGRPLEDQNLEDYKTFREHTR